MYMDTCALQVDYNYNLFADFISVLNKNMEHTRTIEFDYVKILAVLQITIKSRLRSVKK